MTETPDQTFGRRLREERQRAGISQTELCRRLTTVYGHTIDPSAVSRTEKGARSVPPDEAVALADLLSIPLDGMTHNSLKAKARILRLRQGLRQAQRHADDTRDELQKALARVAAVRRELTEAESSRRP